jgi:hypothetical protein
MMPTIPAPWAQCTKATQRSSKKSGMNVYINAGITADLQFPLHAQLRNNSKGLSAFRFSISVG